MWALSFEAVREMSIEQCFPVEQFLKSDGSEQLQKLPVVNWPEEAEYLNTDFAKEHLRRLIRRMDQAIDQELFDEPVHVGAAAGALIELAASLCKEPESADYYIDGWRDYDCNAVFEFLASSEEAEHPQRPKKRK